MGGAGSGVVLLLCLLLGLTPRLSSGEEAESSHCVQLHPPGGKSAAWLTPALDSLKKKYASKALETKAGDWQITLRFCPEDGVLIKATGKAAKGKDLILATSKEKGGGDIIADFLGNVIRLTFKGAKKYSNCSESSDTRVLLTCSKEEEDSLALMTTDKMEAFNGHIFTLSTPLACPPPASTPAPKTTAAPAKGAAGKTGAVKGEVVKGGGSWPGTLVTLLFIGLCLYFGSAFLYKRLVMGAQGAEQCPHYLTFARIARVFQDKADGIRRGSFAASSAPVSRAESRDFHPGGGHYDQLPPSAQPQPRPSDESDADDRLLQV